MTVVFAEQVGIVKNHPAVIKSKAIIFGIWPSNAFCFLVQMIVIFICYWNRLEWLQEFFPNQFWVLRVSTFWSFSSKNVGIMTAIFFLNHLFLYDLGQNFFLVIISAKRSSALIKSLIFKESFRVSLWLRNWKKCIRGRQIF